VVLDGAMVEDDVMIGAGSVVTPGKRLAAGGLYLGNPARRARELTAAEVARMLNADLAGQTVYCDGWAHDFPWLALLFDEVEDVFPPLTGDAAQILARLDSTDPAPSASVSQAARVLDR